MSTKAASKADASAGTSQADGIPGKLSLKRLARLSDFIYAAALLILLATVTFAPTELSNREEAWTYLTTEIEVWVTFAISFLIIAYYWISHQIYFSYYIRTDKVHSFLELVYLMFLVVMPVGTHFVGTHPGLFEAKLLASYDIVMVGVMQFITWSYATRNDRLVAPGVPDTATRTALSVQALVLPAAAIVAAVAAYFYSPLWEVVLIVGPVLATLRSRLG